MISISRLDALPKIESWLKEPNIAAMSVHYAKKFAAQIGDVADLFEWRALRVNENDKGIITAYFSNKNTSIILNFHEDGTCTMHATSSDSVSDNTCHLNAGADDWVAVQSIQDSIRLLVR